MVKGVAALSFALSLLVHLPQAHAAELPSTPALSRGLAKIEAPVWVQNRLPMTLGRRRDAVPSLQAATGRRSTNRRSAALADVCIEFSRKLPHEELASLEGSGLRFFRLGDRVSHAGPLYHALAPLSQLPMLAEREDVIYVHNALKPRVPCLDVSVPEIGAAQVWALRDAADASVTGQGITIGTVDTGIDIFHPSFWRLDGGSFRWLDVDSSGAFEAGVDAVDLDGDGKAGAAERLGLIDATGRFLYGAIDCDGQLPPEGVIGNPGVYDPGLDWLFNDADNDGARDFGRAKGFTEADPTYGERLFVGQDADGDGKLEPGEQIVALGTCKVKALLDTSPEEGNHEFLRGRDLIDAPRDEHGHGTAVCGILVGGQPGRRYAGVAPDAELLVATMDDVVDGANWCAQKGAAVVLYEFGSWVLGFLDGSDEIDRILDETAQNGAIAVVPAGNLRGGGKHLCMEVEARGSLKAVASIPQMGPAPVGVIWVSFIWREASAGLEITVVDPTGTSKSLPRDPGGGQTENFHDNHLIWFGRSVSPRGTVRYDVVLWCNDPQTESLCAEGMIVGEWAFELENPSGNSLLVDGFLCDDVSTWSGGAVWAGEDCEARTITSPATADRAVAVRSYSTRGCERTSPGALSFFSGQGPRIDGQPILGVAAPGHFDLVTACSGAALQADEPLKDGVHTLGFGGTSAAGPHVAGACALILQKHPAMSAEGVREALEATARRDEHTGTAPDPDLWGRGKIDVLKAVEWTPSVPFLRGDASPDKLDITDAIFVLNYLFLGGEPPGCLDAGDVDDNGELNLTDPVYALRYLFVSGPAPAEPFPACGTDPTEDAIDCGVYPLCP